MGRATIQMKKYVVENKIPRMIIGTIVLTVSLYHILGERTSGYSSHDIVVGVIALSGLALIFPETAAMILSSWRGSKSLTERAVSALKRNK